MNSIGKHIEKVRKKHELNKAKMAAKLGISPQRLGLYERGERVPKNDFLKKWKEVFKEDLSETYVSFDSDIGHSNELNQVDVAKKLIEYFELIKDLKDENESLKKEVAKLKNIITPLKTVAK